MFDWLRGKPRCPVEPILQHWIEDRFTWLTQELGIERLQRGKIILPTEEFLPNEYVCTEPGIADLMQRVARFMDIDPESLKLHFYEDKNVAYEGAYSSHSAGLYSEVDGCFQIALEVSGLDNPVGVVATLAHEIGHVVLLGQKRITQDDEDHEELTDLLTVFLGLGIFSANSVIQENNWRFGHWSGWSIGRRGYLSMDMYGYALALYTLARDEPQPSWAAYLRPDVRVALKRGVHYIRETSDCRYLPALARDA